MHRVIVRPCQTPNSNSNSHPYVVVQHCRRFPCGGSWHMLTGIRNFDFQCLLGAELTFKRHLKGITTQFPLRASWQNVCSWGPGRWWNPSKEKGCWGGFPPSLKHWKGYLCPQGPRSGPEYVLGHCNTDPSSLVLLLSVLRAYSRPGHSTCLYQPKIFLSTAVFWLAICLFIKPCIYLSVFLSVCLSI